MTAFEVIEQLDPQQRLRVATGTGASVGMTAADLRILMGRWGTMDRVPVCLEAEGEERVVRAAQDNKDWLFSWTSLPGETPILIDPFEREETPHG